MLSCAFSLTQRHQQGEWDLCEEGRRWTAFIVDLCWNTGCPHDYSATIQDRDRNQQKTRESQQTYYNRGYFDVFLYRCFTQPCMHARK